LHPQSKFIITESAELMKWLLQKFPDKSRHEIKSLLAHKQVGINGNVVTKFNYILLPGQELSIQWKRTVEAAPLIGMSILYEDDDLIVIHKEAGLLSVGTSAEKELTAFKQLTDYARTQKAANRIYVVHRLDRDTSGVMMFAKNKTVQQKLQNEWKSAVSERVYLAVVEGKVPKSSGTIRSWLKESKTLKMYSSPNMNDGQEAITHYTRLKTFATCSLLEIRLETGRKNQIRVHMQDIGHPIIGDKKYGAVRNTLGRLGLHASILAFTHPITGEKLRFESPAPQKFLNANI